MKTDLNKLRQTKEYQNTKGYEDNEELNKYYDETWNKQMAEIDLQEGIEEMVKKQHLKEEEYKEWAHQANYSEQMKENRKFKDIAGDPDLIESAKELITNKIVKHFDDVLFEMVCQEMGNNYLFQSDNYLTEAGYDMFEDEWFEFYHEHHGDILYRVKHNLFE